MGINKHRHTRSHQRQTATRTHQRQRYKYKRELVRFRLNRHHNRRVLEQIQNLIERTKRLEPQLSLEHLHGRTAASIECDRRTAMPQLRTSPATKGGLSELGMSRPPSRDLVSPDWTCVIHIAALSGLHHRKNMRHGGCKCHRLKIQTIQSAKR